MLRFTHGDQTIEVDLEKLPLHEGLALQKATGRKLPAFLEAVQAVDMEALAALGWVLVKFRMGKPDTTFEDVCEGRVQVNISDFEDTKAGKKPVPPTSARARVKIPS
jgi:hypothetical protein